MQIMWSISNEKTISEIVFIIVPKPENLTSVFLIIVPKSENWTSFFSDKMVEYRFESYRWKLTHFGLWNDTKMIEDRFKSSK